MIDEHSDDRRWPRWVYQDGTEPDYRFTYANERTFLAWIRTGLAMMAAGVAAGTLDLGMRDMSQALIAATLITCGAACDVVAWIRWAYGERAMRQSAPLPSLGISAIALLALTLLAVIGLLSAVVPRVQ